MSRALKRKFERSRETNTQIVYSFFPLSCWAIQVSKITMTDHDNDEQLAQNVEFLRKVDQWAEEAVMLRFDFQTNASDSAEAENEDESDDLKDELRAIERARNKLLSKIKDHPASHKSWVKVFKKAMTADDAQWETFAADEHMSAVVRAMVESVQAEIRRWRGEQKKMP